MNYYYTDAANQTQGPVNVQTLAAYAAQGVLHGKSWVLAEGYSEWQSLDTVIPMPPPRVAAPRPGVGQPGIQRPAVMNPYAAPMAMAGPAHARGGPAHLTARPPALIPGLGRAGYVGASIGMGLLILGLTVLIGFLGQSEVALLILIVLAVVASFWLMALRCQNIGWSGWFCLFSLIPVVSVVFTIALLICPPDYTRTRKLDTTAKVLLGVWLALIALFVALIFLVENGTKPKKSRSDRSASELLEELTPSRETSPRRTSSP